MLALKDFYDWLENSPVESNYSTMTLTSDHVHTMKPYMYTIAYHVTA